MKPSDYIKRGWTQGALCRDANGLYRLNNHNAICWCAVGAIDAAYERIADVEKACEKLEAIVGHIPTWNDTPGRTKEEVIAALEAIGE